MINKLLYIFIIFFLNIFINFNTYGAEEFNFDVTEVEILENGNIFKGIKKGTIKTNDGVTITADTFIYDKVSNILNASGNVEIYDTSKNLKIFSQKAIYNKNNEILITKDNSKAIYENGKFIFADTFKFDRFQNIINANGNVKMEDSIDNYLIFADDATYYKNSEKITTKGKTQAFIQSKYNINSKDVTYLHNEQILTSKHRTKIQDQNSQVYFAEKFNYHLNQEIIKGEEVLIITNYNLPKSDKFFLENAIINLKDRNFIAKETEVKIHKDIFNIEKNDPRIVGVSSSGDKDYTLINKGVFTSCKKNDSCSAWSIKATKIKHDKIKRELIYDNPIIRIYDIPVFYLPKFYHPDPSVKRKSGFLKPEINNSNVLGSSFTMPYFKVISENQDLTLTPIWFDTDTIMSSVEYRQKNENSTLLADFAAVNNYESYTTKKRNTLSHFFLDFDLDLNLKNFETSNLNMFVKRVSKESYLSVFQQYITKEKKLRPTHFHSLENSVELDLQHQNYEFQTGLQAYDSLGTQKKSDRYQYVLPHYSFSNTNALETNITNTLTYNSLDFISNLGFRNYFGINLKQLNSIGKKSSNYKSNPQSEIISLYNFNISLPLIKESERTKNLITPKLSLRINPSDMKNYSNLGRTIDANNAFAINRLGLSHSYESGRSLTLGLDYNIEWLKPKYMKEEGLEFKYKNTNEENIEQINNYFNVKLATVLRDKEEIFIPNSSTLNRKNSNLFGSVTNKFSDNVEINYNFSLDNDFNTLEYNAISTTLSNNNIITTFDFIEENGERGDASLFYTTIDYTINDENFLKFKTKRNRKLNLTNYYDLVYEYKNDCLTAGIKYKKTYYKSGDLRPTQNLLFTITLFPLTTHEHDADDLLKTQDSFLNNLELSEEMFK